MRLKRLIVQGFKSFKDRTTITFDDGITGIVGPNGCGKSNIVDALFWVMGEMSAKHLRGNSMKDLIFAGSSKYNPGSFAEVSLVLENDTGKHIHIGNKVLSPNEIQLTRKLYRNGDTEYRINNIPCRLRDIQEVFMDTGAGAKSYSIIAQGEINKLVQAKPEERRTMIEDVAGITKFKVRRKESMKKIEQTQSNLNRLNDLQSEIEKNLRSLQKQAEKAERARSLKEKVKRNEIVVDAHKVFDHLKYFRDSLTSLSEKKLELGSWWTEKDSIELSLEEERIEREDFIQKIEILQTEFNDVSKLLAASEEKLNFLCKNQTEKENLIDGREKEMESLIVEIEERKNKAAEIKDVLVGLEAQMSEDHDFSELEERVELLTNDLEDKEAALLSLKDEIDEEKSEWQKLDQTIFKNNSRLSEFSTSLEDISEEIETLENQYSSVSKGIIEEREATNSASELVDELTNREQMERGSLDSLKEEVKSLETKTSGVSKELIKEDSRLNSLREIKASLDGVKEGASSFISSEQGGDFKLLGDLVQCDEKYTDAVQNILGQYMDAIVSNDGMSDTFYEWSKTNKDKAVDYLQTNSPEVVSLETIERIKLILGAQELVQLSDIVTLPEEYKIKLQGLLQGLFLVADLNPSHFEKLNTGINFKAIASFDGAVVVKNIGDGKILSFTGNNEGMGAIARNNMIVELESLLETLNIEHGNLENEYLEKDELLKEMALNYDQLRDELSDAKADFAAKKSALESKLSNLETGSGRLEILKNRKSETSKSRLELLESEESLTKGWETLKESISEKEERHEEEQEELLILKGQFHDEKQELIEKQVEAKSFGARHESSLSQSEDINQQINKQESRLVTGNDLIAQYKKDIEEIILNLETVEKDNSEMALNLRGKEEILDSQKDALSELLSNIQEREEKVKKLTASINKNDKDITAIEIKLDQSLVEEEQLVRNLFEKHRVDLRLGIGQFLEFDKSQLEQLKDISSMYFIETEDGQKELVAEDYQFNRRYGQDLKDCSIKLKSYKTEYSRLGEINWQAIEDYERQKIRFDFLKIQEGELKQSLEDLENAIEHIDQKSKTRFKIAFEEVNVRFEKVFPIIFGGGNASLKLTKSFEDPECGVDIIAQPPGKKMQNINLMSGGEKALTAVSLIFSIFLVKPSPFCLLDEVDAPLDDANVGRFNQLLREMSSESQFILITHNKKTMELNDTLYGVTMQEPGVSKAVSVQLH